MRKPLLFALLFAAAVALPGCSGCTSMLSGDGADEGADPDGAIAGEGDGPDPAGDAAVPDLTDVEPGELGVLLGDGPIRYDGGIIIGADGGADGGDGGGPRVCYVTQCQNHVYQCGNCMDDDGDGKIDSEDPDCLGPCDNSEGSFEPAIPGGNNAPCKADCYFDQDTGSGNDQCYWDHRCDPNEVAPAYNPEGAQCAYQPTTKAGGGLSCAQAQMMQSAQCKSFCGPLTPNGCDCFGCCSFPGLAYPVWLGSRDAGGTASCTSKTVNDPTKCRRCQKVAACDKPCGRCQLCIGKDTVPDDCYMSGGDGGAGGDGRHGGEGGGVMFLDRKLNRASGP